MRLRWTPASADDLEAIADYLAGHFPNLARTTIRKIYETIGSLRSMPYRGRIGREEGTRELVIARLPYIIVYRIKGEAVEICTSIMGLDSGPEFAFLAGCRGGILLVQLKNSAIAAITVCCSSSRSSGKMGRARTSLAARSASGKLPSA